MSRDIYKSSRVMYIIEAALEYFISIMVGGAYLAKLAEVLELSTKVTGILSAFTTLGCSFQIFAIFIWKNNRVKRSVTILHTVNQLLFTFLYVIPVFEIPTEVKTAIFIVMILSAHIINNMVQSPKINWFMSLVDDTKRGRFTANKEIISLIGGMIFTFVMGNIIDSCEAAGKTGTSLVICGVTLAVLTVLHTCTLIFSKEKEPEVKERIHTKDLLRQLIKDTGLLKVVGVSVLWSIAHSVTTPFLGSYQINKHELAFSMTFVSILSAIYAICRALASRPLGKYADKNSFVKMLNICFIVMAVAFTVNIFTVPSNGKILYTVYYVLYAVGMAGINSGGINLIYEYVPKEQRICALALKNTIQGIAGFLTTLLFGEVVDLIQENGNKLFGISMYAQQFLSAISVILIIGLIIYLNTVVRKISSKKADP